MGTNSSIVGGGRATGVADAYNNFLMQQLTGMGQGQGQGQGNATNSVDNAFQQMSRSMGFGDPNRQNAQNSVNGINQNISNGMSPQNAADIWRQQSNQMQPGQQSGSAFSNLFNQMAGGKVNDQSGAQGMLQNFFRSQGQGQRQAPQQSNPMLQNQGAMGQGSMIRPSVSGQGAMGQGGQDMSWMTGGPPTDSSNSGMGLMPRDRSNDSGPGGGTPPQMFPQGDPSQGDPSQYGGNQLPTFENPYQNQQFQGFNPSQLGTNFGQGQSGMMNMNNFGNIAGTNTNVMQGFGSQGQSGFTNQLNQLMQSMQNGGQQASAQSVALDPAKQIDLNSPLIQAQQQIADRQRNLAVADQRARFGADGSGSLGTGAQVAESNLNAQYGPQMAALLQQNIQQQQSQDLAERQTKAGIGVQSAGLGAQASIANAGNSLQGMMSAMNGGLTGRAQDFGNQLGNRQAGNTQLGLALGQDQGNQGAMLQNQGQMLNAGLQNQGMGNAFGLNAFNANSQNQQQNNANGMGIAGMQNNFNLSNAGNMAQFGQGTNGLNLQSALGGQGNLLSAIQMGMGQNQLGNSNQNNILSQLFGGFGQSNGLGTPQAQVVQSPNPWMQGLQGIAGIGSSLFSSGIFNRKGGDEQSGGGGGGGSYQWPQGGSGGFGGSFGGGSNGGWGGTNVNTGLGINRP